MNSCNWNLKKWTLICIFYSLISLTFVIGLLHEKNNGELELLPAPFLVTFTYTYATIDALCVANELSFLYAKAINRLDVYIRQTQIKPLEIRVPSFDRPVYVTVKSRFQISAQIIIEIRTDKHTMSEVARIGRKIVLQNYADIKEKGFQIPKCGKTIDVNNIIMGYKCYPGTILYEIKDYAYCSKDETKEFIDLLEPDSK